MTLAHAAYLFQANKFCQEIQSLRSDLDQGDYTSLYKRAHEVLESSSEKVWNILDDFRYGPEEMPKYEEEDRDRAKPWIWMVLSQYIVPCLSIDCPTWKVPVRRELESIPRARNWQVLNHVLKSIGWDERDVFLLIEGMSMPWLFRLDLVTDPVERLKPSNAWHSLFRTGWLDTGEIQRLLGKLEISLSDVYRWKPTTLPGYYDEKPVPEEQVEMAFLCAMGMLKTADAAQRDLFSAILS